MLMSRDYGLLSRVEPAERRGSRHENRISRPRREPLGAKTDVYSMTSTRADDMTIVFFFFSTSLLEKP